MSFFNLSEWVIAQKNYLFVDSLFWFLSCCVCRRWTSVCCLRHRLLDPEWATQRRAQEDVPSLGALALTSEDGGPVCLLPCLKAAWGFFSPSSFPLCMWNTVKKLPWHFADLLLEMHSPAVSELLPATSCSIIPNSKIVTSWFPLAALVHAWKEFPVLLLDFNPVLALISFGRWEKLAFELLGVSNPPRKTKTDRKSFKYSACPLVYNIL